jgi:predicted RNA-binding protein
MCLSKAYIEKDGETEFVMDEVASLKVEPSKLLLTTLLGEQKEISAEIREVDFLAHTITLANLKEGEL